MLCNAICVQRCKGAKAKALASPRLMARTLDRAKGQGASCTKGPLGVALLFV